MVIVLWFLLILFLINYTKWFPVRFGVMLIDYKMIEMAGCELANKIVTLNLKIKKVLITAYDDIKNNDLNL